MKLDMMFHTGGEQQTELDEAARKKVESYVADRVGGFRCPDHDQAPTIICRGSRLDSLSFEVKGCCQKVIYLVQQKLEE